MTRPNLVTKRYSPHDLLPAPEPRTVSPPATDFYSKVSKHLIPDLVRIMHNGIPIDLTKVRELEKVLQTVLTEVADTLAANPVIRKFQILQHGQLRKDYIAERRTHLKTPLQFIKPFKPSDMNHRSYFMQEIVKLRPNIEPPEELLPTGVPKWSARAVKAIVTAHPALALLLEKRIQPSNIIAKRAMLALARDKATIYNRKYLEDIVNADDLELPAFNPGSSIQKQKLFAWLGLESDKISKDTGQPSWDRDEVERVNRETEDPHIKELTQAMIDHSFSAIVKNNFIKAFYAYTIDGVLYGGLKLFGAKSFRLTSQNPNLLNMPSTRSIYSKPIKKCFVAPEGKVILAIDYGALEDRVMASLSRDENKCNIFLQGLDGHCLNAYGYFREEVAEHMEVTDNTSADVKAMYELVEAGNSALKAIRQKGKPATFGLSYGAFPPKVAASLKISLAAAKSIFERYHEVLYPGITKYREKYVLPTTELNGKIHLGLGCYISSDRPGKDIRTLNNATCQFWSILTLLTINKMHALIDERGYSDRIHCISTIYDSIYYLVDDDPKVVKWLNDHLVTVMVQDFMEDQTIPNTAISELGLDWATMEQIPNGASIEQIEAVLYTIGSRHRTK